MSFKEHLNYFVDRTKVLIHKVDWANVSPYTYARYILMIVSAINLIAKAFGYDVINVDENDLVEKITYILPVVMLIVNTYKDNPTSKEAIEYHNKMVETKTLNKQTAIDEIRAKYNHICTPGDGCENTDESDAVATEESVSDDIETADVPSDSEEGDI